ncbi:MAG TPA: hypothetical protein PK765_02220 [bacterium]|nr:hypothetical protein [bacterium]
MNGGGSPSRGDDDGVFSDDAPDEMSQPKAKRSAKKTEEDIHIEDIPF